MPSLHILNQEDEDTTLDKNTQPLCYICQQQIANYTCPRCNLRYCSLTCYKDQKHTSCTESFYKESVLAELKTMDTEDLTKKSMQKILNRFEAENLEQEELLDDDIQEGLKTLDQRFGNMDITKADASVIWDLLSPQEQHDFQALMKTDAWQTLALPEYEPWWTTPASKIKSIDNQQEDEEGVESDIPALPTAIPELSSITKSSPSHLLTFHLLHVLMTYAYITRQTMGDLADDIQYSLESLYYLSQSILFSSTASAEQYRSVNDICTDLRRQVQYQQEQTQTAHTDPSSSSLDIMLLKDAECLLTLGNDYAVRALGELYQLLDHFSKDKELSAKCNIRTTRKQVGLAARKAYFFMVYANHLSQQKDQVSLFTAAIRSEYMRLQHDQDVFEEQVTVAKSVISEQRPDESPDRHPKIVELP